VDKQTVMANLTRVGVVPVVRAESSDNVVRAVEALVEGGIPVAEITMTVPGAVTVIERCAAHFGDRITLGAGSVTGAGMCIEVIDAGIVFVVTPVFKAAVIDACKHRGVCVVAGALTPTEIFMAWEAGADVVKVFPAKAMGGAAYLRMVHEPLPQIPLTPTGGVTLETLADYFKAGVPFVGAGGDLVSKKAIDAGDTLAITKRARQYVAAIRAARSQLPA
jgi:2-dehydro-3-deoxyphosphogluconate aldolase / (4S)-4-hydroxy-2-oxoglutarate aldolase